MAKIIRLLPWFLIAGISMLLLGSTIYKAYTTSFTHDESYTYNHFVTTPVTDIVTYKFVSPNNHLVNTLLMKLSGHFLGPSELALRLPNLLAHLAFMLFSLLILRKFSAWLILPLFILLNCNPYLLDFFSLARGNGLSYGFMMGSLFFILRYIESNKTSLFFWSALLAFLGVLSHFTLIYFLVALFIAVELWVLSGRYFARGQAKPQVPEFLRINAIILGFSLLLAAVMAGPVIKLVKAGQLFYGGETGFWRDTVGTLVETFFYGMPYGPAWVVVVQALILVTMIGVSILFLYAAWRKSATLFSENRSLWLVFMVLTFAVVINVTQFYLLGIKLPVRRYGLFYFPLFVMCFGFLLVYLSAGKVKWVGFLLGYGLALLVSFHMIRSFSPATYLDWPYEKETKKVMTLLSKEVGDNNPDHSVTLGITWLFEPTVNFYRTTRGYNWMKEVTRDGPGIQADYYYVLKEDFQLIPYSGSSKKTLFNDGTAVFLKSN